MPLLQAHDGWFRDEHGRAVLLRGVNLGGSSKMPASPDSPTHQLDSLNDARTISFIGRPFPLQEADEHFTRLRAWGFNVLRLLITWEAIEHAGPGEYDTAFLDWFAELVRIAGMYDFFVFIDPHQDAWGRWSGGDGAPRWTYTAVGLNPDTFDATEAAITMQRRYPDDYPPMVWSSNYRRFAASTMYTLFFGGNDFAPQARIEGESVQDYLQRHFCNAFAQVAERLRDMPHVLGYGIFNEPSAGYIGQHMDGGEDIFPGPRPSPYDGMLMAAGFARRVPVYRLVTFQSVRVGTQLLNPEGHAAWLPGAPDIWHDAGVWELQLGQPNLLRPDYFLSANDAPVDFANGYLKPFMLRFTECIRTAHPDALIFLENEPFQAEGLRWEPDDPPGIVNANHWYDVATLYTKHFNSLVSVDVYARKPIFGGQSIIQMFTRQVSDIKARSEQQMGNCPTLIGEFGVPYDMDDGAAYKSGDFQIHAQLLDMYYNALDANLVHATQWCYTADNDNRWGDRWNQEDLSIFSRDQQQDPSDINSGARGLEGFCRPFAHYTAGTPIAMKFDRASGMFELSYTADPSISAPTEIYVPRVQYPHGYDVELSSGEAESNEDTQCLLVRGAEAGEQRITVRRREVA